MLRVISLVLILGLLASIGTSIAEVLDPQPDSQWEFLGKTICDSDIPNKTFYIWKKINSTNEFKSLQYQEPCTQDEINRNVCYYPEPVFYRMDTKHDFKMFFTFP